MTHAEVTREIAKTKTHLAKLEALKRALEDLGKGEAAPPEPAKARHKPAPARTGRAPRGTLERAILDALAAGGGLVNREIRAKVKASGYKYSLAPLHVGKTLTRMTSAKLLTIGHQAGRVEYTAAAAPNSPDKPAEAP